jgi:hypothetical protein
MTTAMDCLLEVEKLIGSEPLSEVLHMNISKSEIKTQLQMLVNSKLSDKGSVGRFIVSFRDGVFQAVNRQVSRALNKTLKKDIAKRLDGGVKETVITPDGVSCWVGRPSAFRNVISGKGMEMAVVAAIAYHTRDIKDITIEYNVPVTINGLTKRVDIVIHTPNGNYYLEVKNLAGLNYMIDIGRHNGSPFFFMSNGKDYNQHMIDYMLEKNCQPIYALPREYKGIIPPPIKAWAIEDFILAIRGDRPEEAKGKALKSAVA